MDFSIERSLQSWKNMLEEVLSYMDMQQLCDVVWRVNSRWSLAVHNIISSNYRRFGPTISNKISTARRELLQIRPLSPTALDQELVLVAEYTFLQILYAEYKTICTIYWNHSKYDHLYLEAGVCLAEFRRLLNQSTLGLWDWKVENISLALDDLRNLNTRFLHYFFWHIWDPKEEKLGPMVLDILDCSLYCSCNVTATHVNEPQSADLPCSMNGHYEIQDLSNTLKLLLPDLWKHEPIVCARILLCYVCDAIRWGNLFHMLRLRWISMDRALAIGRRREIIAESISVFVSDCNRNKVLETFESEDRQNIVTILKREQANNTDYPVARLGLRCEFQLKSTLAEAPVSVVGRDYRMNKLDLNEDDEIQPEMIQPYHFKMEFRACVRAIRSRLIECTVWVEETGENITIEQNKETVA